MNDAFQAKFLSDEDAKAGSERLLGALIAASLAPETLVPRKRTFEENLARVASGEVGITPAFKVAPARVERTLGGVSWL